MAPAEWLPYAAVLDLAGCDILLATSVDVTPSFTLASPLALQLPAIAAASAPHRRASNLGGPVARGS